jgi:hypothetical protein
MLRHVSELLPEHAMLITSAPKGNYVCVSVCEPRIEWTVFVCTLRYRKKIWRYLARGRIESESFDFTLMHSFRNSNANRMDCVSVGT